jgi:SHS2 domain-containing protein
VSVYRWIDHTGELELEIEAASEEGVFEEGLAAVGAMLGERAGEPTRVEPTFHEVVASAADASALLAEWLSELVYLVESESFVPEAVKRIELRGNTVHARVAGRRGSPPHLIKAVTYHRLGMWKESGAWRARIIFDV